MEKTKFPNLSEIAEDWGEEYYRSRRELSYSQLSKYAREGFDGYLHLQDKISTPSLVFGSALDCLLTEPQEFYNKFLVSSVVLGESKQKKVIEILYQTTKGKFKDFNLISNDMWEFAMNEADYYKNYSFETRMSKFKTNDSISKKYKDYYESLSATDKIIISNEVFNDINVCKENILRSIAGKLFIKLPFSDNEDLFYQLKFKSELQGIGYRCMADVILVNHTTKTIFPFDLKTSSKEVYNFPKSFIEWRYDIQARLYWRIINENVIHSKSMFDYKVDDYRFVVVNRFKKDVMVWKYEDTKKYGTLTYGEHILKDPFVYGMELRELIDNNSSLPLGVSYTKENSICKVLTKC